MFVKFWIKSSRQGTDTSTVVQVDNETSKDDIKWLLEEWCDSFKLFDYSYGWEEVSADAKVLGQQYNRLRSELDRIVGKLKQLIQEDKFSNARPMIALTAMKKASKRLTLAAKDLDK